MQAKTEGTEHKLPGRHGQFGETVTTETYKTLRATQRVTVKPVVLRRSSSRTDQPGSGRTAAD